MIEKYHEKKLEICSCPPPLANRSLMIISSEYATS